MGCKRSKVQILSPRPRGKQSHLIASLLLYNGHAIRLCWRMSTKGIVADELQSNSQGLYRGARRGERNHSLMNRNLILGRIMCPSRECNTFFWLSIYCSSRLSALYQWKPFSAQYALILLERYLSAPYSSKYTGKP